MLFITLINNKFIAYIVMVIIIIITITRFLYKLYISSIITKKNVCINFSTSRSQIGISQLIYCSICPSTSNKDVGLS